MVEPPSSFDPSGGMQPTPVVVPTLAPRFI
jgi:hypothetical protein